MLCNRREEDFGIYAADNGAINAQKIWLLLWWLLTSDEKLHWGGVLAYVLFLNIEPADAPPWNCLWLTWNIEKAICLLPAGKRVKEIELLLAVFLRYLKAVCIAAGMLRSSSSFGWATFTDRRWRNKDLASSAIWRAACHCPVVAWYGMGNIMTGISNRGKHWRASALALFHYALLQEGAGRLYLHLLCEALMMEICEPLISNSSAATLQGDNKAH